MTRGLGLLLVLVAPTACLTGPDEEPKSNLEYLNGERYHGSNVVSGIPLSVERVPKATTISGKAREQRSGDGQDLYLPPVRFARLVLEKDGKVVAAATTDEAGNFSFQGSFPDGSYQLRIDSPLFTGEKLVRVEGYELPSITLDARRKR